jgi:DNA repair photolyase
MRDRDTHRILAHSFDPLKEALETGYIYSYGVHPDRIGSVVKQVPLSRKGRGVRTNPAGRFERTTSAWVDDGWTAPEVVPKLETEIFIDRARSVIARNQSPDVPFEQSINPYRGCEHGCVYCFARPSHAYLDLSPGLDFETKIFFKEDAAKRLAEELAAPAYRPRVIAIGTNTDPYQPIERRLRVMRGLLEVLGACRHPVSIVTKGALIDRDIDLLADMARDSLVSVMISITTLDPKLKATLEPRAAAPATRLANVRRLSGAGIPTGVLIAPVIPGINDDEIEAIATASAEAGAQSLGYVLLRLPWEVKELFVDWLATHAADKAHRVLHLVRELHGGREYDASFWRRQTGGGPYSDLLRRRFELARRRTGLEGRRMPELRTDLFVPPEPSGQLRLL